MAMQSGPRWVSAIDRVAANQGWPLREVPLYFYPAHKPPPPRRRLIPQSKYWLFKPLGCLLLECLPRTRTARINDGHASYFAGAPCFLAPQSWSSSTWSPPPTNNEVMLYGKRGRNRERNCRIPRISPPAFLYRLTLQKRGVYPTEHTTNTQL